MADFSIGDQILEEALYQNETIIPTESDDVQNAKKQVIREAFELFTAHYGAFPISELKCSISPGRVNLIGEHIDYCDGIVLPMAIPLYTVLIGRRAPDDRKSSIFFSSHTNESIEIKQPYDMKKVPLWARYILGVLDLCDFTPSLDVFVHSNIPIGAGLSSSAALEVATLLLIEQYQEIPQIQSEVDYALLCRQCEHLYANVPCGFMDQYIVCLAQPQCALKIDCRSLDYDQIPISFTADAVFLVTDSGVKHALASGEYAKRKKTVDHAVQLLGVQSWREVSHELIRTKSSTFEKEEHMMDNACHVVDEIERTMRAVEALLDNNLIQFGKLMTESHISLRDKYRVSCAEVDSLVDIQLDFPGVFGSRMTGGGFGGCTVTLVRRDKVEELQNHIKEKYTYGEAAFIVCEPVGGAKPVSLDFIL